MTSEPAVIEQTYRSTEVRDKFNTDVALYICEGCGSLVWLQEAHDRWHASFQAD